ncbi:hypothetical protein [Celeribacter litoreus]|uniref:hypothetical protein n=1 Tax=Celeribacter litoreus TaxID=2876714 RepID=UPI001CCC044D|nr:hypothetical protein [Celeribacter litoreus]MCA0044656.1 hypothetical protein [Celeribacter litoreus]
MPSTSKRVDMVATLNDIISKPMTQGRARAAGNIRAALQRMDEYAARNKPGGKHARTMTIYDREVLMSVIDDPSRTDEVRDRAKYLVNGSGDLSEGDTRFLDTL